MKQDAGRSPARIGGFDMLRDVCDVCLGRYEALGWTWGHIIRVCRGCKKEERKAKLVQLGYMIL